MSRRRKNVGTSFSSGFEGGLDLGLDFDPDFDLDFGLDLDLTFGGGPEYVPLRWYGDARSRTWRAVNLDRSDEARVTGRYDMPVLAPCTAIPRMLVDFNAAMKDEVLPRGAGIHFFIDDYRFERVWRIPGVYAERIVNRAGIALTPDFSLYLDMPEAMKVWNVYRSRLIGQIFQDAGLNVIPTLQWAEPGSYDYCFDGVPEGATVAVSTVGVMMDEGSRRIWRHGMREALERLRPQTVLLYGAMMPDFDFGAARVRHYAARKWKKTEMG